MCVIEFSRKIRPPYVYVAVGTGFISTEDNPSIGRLLLFAVVDNVL